MMKGREFFQAQYGRPAQLSDPGSDFRPEDLKRILVKADDELGWADFAALFQVGLPAGTYEETLYFFPLAFDYYTAGKDEAFEFVSGLAYFVAKNASRLAADGLQTYIIEAYSELLETLTAEFTIRHLDHQATRAMGSSRDHIDYVLNSDRVTAVVESMDMYGALPNVAIDFLRSLSQAESGSVQSCWYLEIARFFQRTNHPPYGPPYIPELQVLVTEKALLQHHLAPILEDASRDNPTFWSGMLEDLAI